MKILLCVASARLAYGGPALSVAALARNLARSGAEVGLWCPDGSAMGTEPDAPGAGLRRLAGSLDAAIADFGMPDIVHDNGIWWRHNHRIARFARRSAIPRLVSPRGMLEPWARRHKPVRKAIAWQVYQLRDLQQAAALHATSAPEQANLAVMLPDRPAVLIGNGLDLPDEAKMAFLPGSGVPEHRQALFLGRIHPVKGLALLLRAWPLAAPADWRLVIAGPDENGHRAELEQEIARLGIAPAISFAGPVTGEAKARLFAGSHLFVLPSHSESFGMSVGEALAHGLPVLTTKNVPWPQLEPARCGWRAEVSVASIAEALGQATACPDAELAAMGRRGRQLVAEEFGWEGLTQRFLGLYADLLSHGSKPDMR